MAKTTNFILTSLSDALNEVPGLEGYWFDSSVIKYACHDSISNTLFIRFTSGKEYVYMNVDKSVWHDFADADSQGKFFNKNIRGKYDFEFVEDAA